MTTDRLIPLKEVAALTGISLGTLRRWAYSRAQPFPVKKVSTRLYVRQSDFERWLDSLESNPAAAA